MVIKNSIQAHVGLEKVDLPLTVFLGLGKFPSTSKHSKLSNLSLSAELPSIARTH